MNSAVSTPSRPTARNASVSDGQRAGLQRLGHLGAQFAGHARGGLLHPQHHRGDDRDRDQRRDPGDRLGGEAADGVLAELDDQEHRDGHRDRRADAQPHPFQRVAAIGLHQERHQDHHDDRGFQALAQTDQRAAEQLGRNTGARGQQRCW